ncbi:MAG: TIGR00725 family protein [Candidatus Aureabacteria bacterium]|nr:TIGR00725 family protein [Candidatus Auribacterota bacterium]
MRIGVIGGSSCSGADAALARETGRVIALQKHILISGGMGGVMEEACKGAFESGGITVGILPGEDEKGSNKYLTAALPTGIGAARNIFVVKASDALIAIGGWYGTLSEMAFALNIGRPVVGLNTWKCSINGRDAELITAVSAAEAVEKAVKAASALRRYDL